MPEPFLERGRLSLHLLPVPCHQQNVIITKSLVIGGVACNCREIVFYYYYALQCRDARNERDGWH